MDKSLTFPMYPEVLNSRLISRNLWVRIWRPRDKLPWNVIISFKNTSLMNSMSIIASLLLSYVICWCTEGIFKVWERWLWMFLAIPYCLCIKHWETILGEGNGGVKGGSRTWGNRMVELLEWQLGREMKGISWELELF